MCFSIQLKNYLDSNSSECNFDQMRLAVWQIRVVLLYISIIEINAPFVFELKRNPVIIHRESPKLVKEHLQTLTAFNENFIRHGFALKTETERSTEDRENERDRDKGGGREERSWHRGSWSRWSKDTRRQADPPASAKEGIRIPTIKWPDCAANARRSYIGGGSTPSSLSTIPPSAKFSYMGNTGIVHRGKDWNSAWSWDPKVRDSVASGEDYDSKGKSTRNESSRRHVTVV